MTEHEKAVLFDVVKEFVNKHIEIYTDLIGNDGSHIQHSYFEGKLHVFQLIKIIMEDEQK